MFAIISNNGKQYKVTKDTDLKIDRSDLEAGGKITFDQILLIDDGKTSKVGTPLVKGASVTGEVIENKKDKKIIVFKKKRRQNYRRKTGHRQEYTVVKIKNINIS